MEKFCLLFSLLMSLSNLQIVYSIDNPGSNQKADSRSPVHVPGQCPEHQWYWPGEHKSDWVCDCARRFVYHPPTDKCYELYRQGPCQKNEYLVLPKEKVIAECVNNPCMNDTMVSFNGKCHLLYKTDACVANGGGTLNVNGTSLELECLPASAVGLNIIRVAASPCPSGSKRSAKGQCRPVVG